MDDENDHQRFTDIYDAHRQRVWAYVVSRAGRQVAEEVVSETFAIAWRRLDDMPSNALTWLIGVARNVLRERIRSEARQDALRAEIRAWSEDDHAEEVTERLFLLNALATLSEDDTELLMLTAWHGLSPRDAARVVGCSQATLRVRLHRARRRLTEAIARHEVPTAPSSRVTVRSGHESP